MNKLRRSQIEKTIDKAPIGCYFINEREVSDMTIKEMREKLGLTQELFSQRYGIPRRTIQNWESGKRKPPAYVIEMLENAVKHYKPRTEEEIMSMPLTIIDLKYMCDDYIRKGYGEKSVLLSNENDDGYHGMYFGFGPEDEYEDYVTLN